MAMNVNGTFCFNTGGGGGGWDGEGPGNLSHLGS